MTFSLINTTASYQHLINNIICEFLDIFFMWYLDNILIYSKNTKEHKQYIWLVLKKTLKCKNIFYNRKMYTSHNLSRILGLYYFKWLFENIF